MKTCKTCIYWNRYYNIVNGISDCDRHDSLPDPPTNLTMRIDVFVHDDSGLGVHLMTGEDFGCALHHPKK